LRTESLSWKLAAVCVAACGARGQLGRAYSEGRAAPPEIQLACALTSRRCGKCHPIERLKLARVRSPSHWALYVERMRLEPESDIAEADSRVIVRCLVFQRFGPEGLEALRAGREGEGSP